MTIKSIYTAQFFKLSFIKVSVLAIASVVLTACGEVEEGDGNIVNSITLPTGNTLTFQCADVGLAAEDCILDDPENPYAITPVNDETKWDLDRATTSAKARYYLWATAQARSPRGENQYFTARALQEIYTLTDNEVVKNQAIRAYRSVLDNYFHNVTFWQFPNPPAVGQYFYPKSLRLFTVYNLFTTWVPTSYGAGFSTNIKSLYATDLEAFQALGEWGYTYEPITDEVTKNF